MQAAPWPDSSTHHFCRAHEQKASHGFAIADAKPASPVPCGCAAWLHEPCAAGEQPVQQQIWWARASVDRELGLCNRLRWLGPLSPEFREEPQRSNTARARRVCEPEQRARERRRDRLRTCAQVPAAPAGSSLHCSLSSHRRSLSGNQPSTQEPSGGAAGKLGREGSEAPSQPLHRTLRPALQTCTMYMALLRLHSGAYSARMTGRSDRASMDQLSSTFPPARGL